MNEMEFLNDDVLIHAIESIDGGRFDTHDVIKAIMRVT